MRLTVNNGTWAKLRVAQAENLPDSEKVWIPATSQFDIASATDAEGQHVAVRLEMPLKRETDWFFFKGHISIAGTEPDNKPQDAPAKEQPMGASILLPGYGSHFFLNNPIIPGGHFTWGEATHGGTRIPENKEVVGNILAIAQIMEQVRTKLGGVPITVNSWYRDPATNRKVGGARSSRHIAGDAVDFTAQGITPGRVNQILDPWWGAKGGLASATCFTHIDARGYKARWDYGF